MRRSVLVVVTMALAIGAFFWWRFPAPGPNDAREVAASKTTQSPLPVDTVLQVRPTPTGHAAGAAAPSPVSRRHTESAARLVGDEDGTAPPPPPATPTPKALDTLAGLQPPPS